MALFGCRASVQELPPQLKAQALLARRNDNCTVEPETVRKDELQVTCGSVYELGRVHAKPEHC